MDDATWALLDLWTLAGRAVDDLGPDDWSRPTPYAAMDVTDLVVHLAGIHYAGPDRLRESIATARARTATLLADRAAGDRLLAAHCLDVCLHAHDLSSAVGDPVDLAAYAPAALEGSRLVVDATPRLLVAALGGRDASLHLVVHSAAGTIERTIHVADGRVVHGDPPAAEDVVEIDADALLLLVAGRREPTGLAADGAVRWAGPAAEAFMRGCRLPA